MDSCIGASELSNEASDSDVSFKPSDYEESSDEFVPESSDQSSSSQPISPTFCLRRTNPNCEIETDGAGSQSTVQANTTSEPTQVPFRLKMFHQVQAAQWKFKYSPLPKMMVSYDKPQFCPFCSMPQKKLP